MENDLIKVLPRCAGRIESAEFPGLLFISKDSGS